MRAYLLISLLIGLVALSAGQERAVRGRIRNLIKAAKSGDLEAKQTLRSLRERLLRNRKENARTTSVPPIPEQPKNVIVSRPPPPPAQLRQIPVPSARIPIQAAPKPRTRTRPILEDVSAFDPHRALNTGLEVGSRSELSAIVRVTNRTRTPPIRTIRRYSYFDEDGSYIFGYEAEDGSFKEERRGLDCVVHGKYGYIDPTGVLREYTYTTGNQCDPNAVLVDGEIEKLPLNNQFQTLTSEKRLTHQQAEALILEYKNRPANGRRRQSTAARVEQPRPIQQSPQRIPDSPQIFPQFTETIPQAPKRTPKISQRAQQPKKVHQKPPQRLPQFREIFPQAPQRTPQISQRAQEPRKIHQKPLQIDQPAIPHFNIPQQQNRIQVSQPRVVNAPRIRKPSSQSLLPPFQSLSKITTPKKNVVSRPQPRPFSTTTPTPFIAITTKRGEILPPPFIRSFATTSRPPLSDFNFDRDFTNVFDNFKARQTVSSQPQPRRKTTAQKPQPPQPQPQPTFQAPKLSQPIPSIPTAPKSSHHQLVFDATSGTFKSIPIEQLRNAKQIGSLRVPAGKPLPLPNQINDSGLTQRASPLSSSQINDLFSHFRIKL